LFGFVEGIVLEIIEEEQALDVNSTPFLPNSVSFAAFPVLIGRAYGQ
jgi:hypothetical protein